MLQDKLRSVVYRSLVSCDDPNGVVEYKTMGKSKTSSRKQEQQERKLETRKDSFQSSVHKEQGLFSGGYKEESNIPPSVQILEVSRGVQKLNLMIDSWSKGISFDGQSKDIARDLLKGALDLQESLVLLSELQEASQYLSEKKMKHKHKYVGKIDDVRVERYDSDRFLEKHNLREMQRGRLSHDGSSSNSVEELKKVIRDSLTRQNLLSIPSIEEKASFYPRELKDFSDIPSTSTSSSQSSLLQSNNFVSTDWSVSSTSKKMKAKSPSVIAKLMGLEDFPSETTSVPTTQPKSKKLVDHQRPIIDIEMPNARKAYLLRRNEDPERKTLKEVIETMHLKGLLKGSDVEGFELHRHNSYESCSKQWLEDETPPIVLIKPLHFPCEDDEYRLLRNSSQEEGSCYNFRKLDLREEASNRRSNQHEGALQPEEMKNKREPDEKPLTRTLLQNEDDLNIVEISDKVETEKPPVKKPFRKEGASNSNKELRKKQEVKEPQTRERSPTNNVKQAFVPRNHKPQEKVAEIKNIGKLKRALPNRKTPVEKESVKSIPRPRPSEQVRATTKKCRKPDSGTCITNSHGKKGSTTQNPTPIQSIQNKAHSSLGQAKKNTRKAKPEKESLVNKIERKHKDKEIDRTNTTDPLSIMTSSSPIEDHAEEHKSSLYEKPTENSQHGSSIRSAEKSEQLVDKKIEMEETGKSGINLKELLLNSPAFLASAEEFFELQMNQPTVIQTTYIIEDVNVINTRLLLDCANELIQCRSRSRQIFLVGYPWVMIHVVSPKPTISLEQLIGEVYDGFEKLENYIKVVDDISPTDGIHVMLEKDIKSKGTLGGGLCDLGWEHGFSVNESDAVLTELGKQVLSELIEEIIVEYSNTQ